MFSHVACVNSDSEKAMDPTTVATSEVCTQTIISQYQSIQDNGHIHPHVVAAFIAQYAVDAGIR